MIGLVLVFKSEDTLEDTFRTKLRSGNCCQEDWKDKEDDKEKSVLWPMLFVLVRILVFMFAL